MNSNWDLIGLDRQIDLLKRLVDFDNGIPCLIFAAPEHCGKHSLVSRFTQMLNCVVPDSPCGHCEICRKIDAGIFPDLYFIGLPLDDNDKKKTEISITQIRDVIRVVSLPPYQGQFRVVVLEDADKLSLSAANALLKTMEEPPDNNVFVLLTSRAEAIPETIRSRCLLLEFTRTRPENITRLLFENHQLTDDNASNISKFADGRPGLAVTCALNESIITERNAGFDILVNLLTANFQQRFEIAQSLSNRFGNNRTEVYLLLDNWALLVHDLIMNKLSLTDLVRHTEYVADNSFLIKYLNSGNIVSLFRVISNTRANLERNAGARLCFDLMMLDLPSVESER